MEWADYLSLLTWQNCPIRAKDFARIEVATSELQTPENFTDVLSSLEAKEYVSHNRLWWKKAEKDYKYCQNRNYQLLHPGKKAYPRQLISFFDSPPIFCFLGEWPSKEMDTPITFVGSRQADHQVFHWMDFYLPSLLKEKQICVLSGGARGVDQKAHAVAIRSQSPTLCFLPCGLDHLYPESLNRLKRGILNCGGAFVSSWPPWEKMQKPYFHIRNGYMSALSSLVVILQAQLRSGTMLTAKKSLDYGIPLAVLPGPALSAHWTGNLQLLYDGAYLIRDNIDLSLLISAINSQKVDLSH